MSVFSRRFLAEEAKRTGASSSREIFLALFGKHPTCDDFLPAIGLETESLVLAKQIFLTGISAQQPAWTNLDRPAEQLIDYGHAFLWRRSSQFMLGRLWASRDSKGRAFPLVACVQGAGLPLAWTAQLVLPQLENLQQPVQAAPGSNQLESLVADADALLRRAVTNLPAQVPDPEFLTRHLGQFLSHPDLGPEHQGLHRVLHQLDRQLTAYQKALASDKHDTSLFRPQQIRVPACADSPVQVLLLWDELFHLQLAAETPLLLLNPFQGGWLDAIIGEPMPPNFFCLRASPKAMPLASQIPFTDIEPSVKEKAQHAIRTFHEAKTFPLRGLTNLGPSVQSPARAESGSPGGPAARPSSGWWAKWSSFFGSREQKQKQQR